jgi:hypothetical protein
MAFQRVVGWVFQPLNDYLAQFLGFDVIIPLILTVLVAVVILRNRGKNQSIVGEVENLIRRYVIFRGHRQALVRTHQGDENEKYKMLKAISGSWNQFRATLDGHSLKLLETDRRARNALIILGVIMLVNSLRNLSLEATLDFRQWTGLVFLFKELPICLFLITGFVLIAIQSRRLKKRAFTNLDGELNAILSDMEETRESLDNEFDPIEEQQSQG